MAECISSPKTLRIEAHMTTNSFTGKTALIIGGSSGMGKATATLLLSLGAKVIVASKSGKSVDAAVAELGKHGEVTGKVLNLTDDADVKRFVHGDSSAITAIHL